MSTAIRATILIGFFSILSKVLGAVRQAVFANQFGAGQEMDIYVAAFRIPDLLFNLLIIGTLSVAFIPVFVEYVKSDRSEAFQTAARIFNLTLLVMGGLALLGFIFAGPLTRVIVPGFSGDAYQQTVQLTRIMMLSPVLFSLSSVLTSVLHSFQRFLLAAVAPLFYNLSIIAGVLFFYPRVGLSGLAWGVVLGAFLHFVIQLPSSLKLGLKPLRFGLGLKHPGTRKIGKLFLPRIFGIDLGQISLLIASVVGSTLGAGSLAVFYFAYDLNTVPLGVFAISFAVASFPTMSEYFSRGDITGFKRFFSRTSVLILFLIIPISVLILLLRAQIVRLVLGIGEGTQFDFEDTRQTAQALGFFVLSLFAQSLTPLLARSFYALQNTIVPVITGATAAVINVALAFGLTRFLGADSMALAFTVASIVNMVVLYALLHRRLGDLNDKYMIVRVSKISVASVMMAITTFVTLYAVAPMVDMQTYLGVLIQTVSALVAAVLTYLLAGFIIKLPETYQLMRTLRSWFTRFTRPVTSAVVNMFTDLS